MTYWKFTTHVLGILICGIIDILSLVLLLPPIMWAMGYSEPCTLKLINRVL